MAIMVVRGWDRQAETGRDNLAMVPGYLSRQVHLPSTL